MTIRTWDRRRTRLPAGATTEERFFSKVEKSDACWMWIGGTWEGGYGTFWLGRDPNGKRMLVGAHRYSYELHKGPIPHGKEVCHACDTPSCVNPAHLFLGTHAENMRDCVRKGRRNAPSGPANHMAAMTALQVSEIRERYRAGGVSQQRLADEFGVNQTTISDVVRHITYREVA